MVKSIFRKKPFLPSYNDGSTVVNYSVKFVSEDVSVNGKSSKIASVKRVDVSKLPALPSFKEYDLEVQLKCGVKPQLINVRGVLGGDVNVTKDFERLCNIVEPDKSVKVDVKDDVKTDVE